MLYVVMLNEMKWSLQENKWQQHWEHDTDSCCSSLHSIVINHDTLLQRPFHFIPQHNISSYYPILKCHECYMLWCWILGRWFCCFLLVLEAGGSLTVSPIFVVRKPNVDLPSNRFLLWWAILWHNGLPWQERYWSLFNLTLSLDPIPFLLVSINFTLVSCIYFIQHYNFCCKSHKADLSGFGSLPGSNFNKHLAVVGGNFYKFLHFKVCFSINVMCGL